jgi:hypothetical protein
VQLAPTHEAELGDHLGTGHSIFGEASIVLELDDSPLRVWTKDPIRLTGVETQVVETGLQLADVVAAQHRTTEEQQSVAEPVPGLIEGPPRVGPNDAIGGKSPVRLKPAYGVCGCLGELASRIGLTGMAERSQSVLDIPDRLPRFAETKETHRVMLADPWRKGGRSWSNGSSLAREPKAGRPCQTGGAETNRQV